MTVGEIKNFFEMADDETTVEIAVYDNEGFGILYPEVKGAQIVFDDDDEKLHIVLTAGRL